MATSTSAAQFAGRITKLATVTKTRQAAVVNQGALTAKLIILSEAQAKGVSPSSKIAGGKWGVGYDVRGFNNPTALVRIRGPFHLVDRPTKAHEIRPRRRRGSGKRAITIGDSVYAYAHHPGTRGKGIFRASKVKAAKAVPLVMSQRIIGGWRDALR